MRDGLSLCALVVGLVPLTAAPAGACTCLGGMPSCQALWFRGAESRGRFSAAAPAPPGAEPLGGVRIRLSGTLERDTVSGDDGRYHFDALPVGDYAIGAEVATRPELALEPLVPRPIRIENDRSCASVDLSYAVNGVIEGTLVDSAGTPIPSTIVQVRLERPLEAERPYYGITPTDALGRFSFSGLPPGRYVVGVSLERGPDRGRPWAPVRSSVVEIDAGELRTIAPIVTRLLKPVQVSGTILDARRATGIRTESDGPSRGGSRAGGVRRDGCCG